MENDTIPKVTKIGKFSSIKIYSLLNILQFITNRENVCILLELNQHFAKLISKQLRKDNCINQCLKEMKLIVKSNEEFKFITNNHCINLDNNLKKFKESYTPYTFNRSIYLLSSYIFKDVMLLDLQKNNIGVDGVLFIMHLVKSSKNLLSLNLAYNNISDEGCKFICPALSKSNSLQLINLECNCITDKGLISLSDIISTHKTLKTVKFALNLITFDGVKYLAGLLEKAINQIGVIDFKYNNIIIRDDIHTDYFRKNKISF